MKKDFFPKYTSMELSRVLDAIAFKAKREPKEIKLQQAISLTLQYRSENNSHVK